MASADGYAALIISSFGLEDSKKRSSSLAFTSKSPPLSAKAFTFDAPYAMYYIQSPQTKATEVRSIASGIALENFVLLVESGNSSCFLVIRRARKLNDTSGNPPALIIPVRNNDDLERIVTSARKFNFLSDELTAHASVSSLYDQLRSGAERYFTNRGLFSTYYLRERLFHTIQEHGRNISKEAEVLFSRFGSQDIPDVEPSKVLSILGFDATSENEITSSRPASAGSTTTYDLKYEEKLLRATAIIVRSPVSSAVDSLDIRSSEDIAPSYLAVSALRKTPWVILTNGRIWRLYSDKVSSVSTDYFEIDLEGVATETDPRLLYFVSLFSAKSFVPLKSGISELDATLEGGLQYAEEIKNDLRAKVFDKQLFVNLVRGVVDHDKRKRYSKGELDTAKSAALKLLYRLLFILYAESRSLLPTDDSDYFEISFESLRQRLPALEKEPESTNIWKALRALFKAINKGSPEHNVPEYDGALFEEDRDLDGLQIKNKFMAPALHDLAERESKGIDYQNLGVRHLGSLYEGLLEYSVGQAQKDLVVFRDEILEAKYAEDLKVKPQGYIAKGELYLSIGGLARKGTGSYYTEDEIVSFLVRKGLEPHFFKRKQRFVKHLDSLGNLGSSDKNDRKKLEEFCDDDLLGIRVVDPAMGSGHFLVCAVDEITNWIIDLLKEYPNAPLALRIREQRNEILDEQKKKGIRLNGSLLSDTVILKRLVMKRCVYGVDWNFLAVELAKLSLWLDSFTIGTPLTFLDHHIRCGDSLVGLWLESLSKKTANDTLEKWMDEVSITGSGLFQTVSMPADLTKQEVEQSRKAYLESRERMFSFQIVLDMLSAGMLDEETNNSLPRNLPLVEKTARELEKSKSKKKPDWWASVDGAVELARKFKAFHWEIEFPDAFASDSMDGNSHRGFDVVLTNPPWEGVKPDDDDFFEVYYPKFRNLSDKQEKKKVIKSVLEDKEISREYEEYKDNIEKRSSFFRRSELYTKQGTGDSNLWKLFVERILSLLSDTGTLAIVLDSGIVIHEGAKQLREALFLNRIRLMYEFENVEEIFKGVHPQDKFVLLVVDRGQPTPSFPAAFYLHKVSSLEGKSEQDKFIEMPIELVTKCAPESLSIPEFRNKAELDIVTELYQRHPLLLDPSKGWTISLVNEFHMTNDSALFRTDNKGWPLFEGKHFHQFIPNFEKTIRTVDKEKGLTRTAKIREYATINRELHNTCRLAYRSTGNSTNVRVMIACILPPESFSANSNIVVLPKINETTLRGEEYAFILCYLAGVMNSFVFDFLVRKRITRNLNFFYIYQTPVPAQTDNETARKIAEIAARLNLNDPRYSKFANLLGVESRPISMKERIRLTGQLNLLVAKHYRLSSSQLRAILETFDVVEEDKEIQKLGESFEWTKELIRKFNGEARKYVLDNMGLLEVAVK